MADDSKKRPTILNLSGRPIAPKEDPAILPTPAIMSIEEALRADVVELRQRFEDAKGAIQIHHQTLVELYGAVKSLEDRTVRGRIRRVVAWVELRKEFWRAYAIAWGWIDPPAAEPGSVPLALVKDPEGKR